MIPKSRLPQITVGEAFAGNTLYSVSIPVSLGYFILVVNQRIIAVPQVFPSENKY